MYVDPTGHLGILGALLIGALIGADLGGIASTEVLTARLIKNL